MGALKNKNQKSIILTPEIQISAGTLRMHEIDLKFSFRFSNDFSQGVLSWRLFIEFYDIVSKIN